jgi:hypothetical protein
MKAFLLFASIYLVFNSFSGLDNENTENNNQENTKRLLEKLMAVIDKSKELENNSLILSGNFNLEISRRKKDAETIKQLKKELKQDVASGECSVCLRSKIIFLNQNCWKCLKCKNADNKNNLALKYILKDLKELDD